MNKTPENPQAARTCPYQKKCGGCSSIGTDYQASLQEKEKRIRTLLKPFVSLDGIVGMEQPYHYRNKVHWSFGMTRNGRRMCQTAGIYAEGTHKIVPIEECLIENETADAIIRDIRDLAASFKIRFYDEDTQTGLLRHILVRTAHATGQVMVVLVLASPVLPGKNNLIRVLRGKHPEITTIVINVNDRSTSMILGDRETAAYGRGWIEDELCGRRFRISSRSFYQINSVQTEKLYQTAIGYAQLTGKETVIDAYCGIGTIGIAATGQAGEVLGIELNRDAVRDACANAKRNQTENIRFLNQDATACLLQMAADRRKADVVFMDPPRSGSTEAFMKSVAALSPERVVYISCGPDTLARDLKYFAELGYKARKAEAFDMFPFTAHVETVVQLSRKKPDDVIEIDLNLDELDATSAETKATYEEIKEYVLKETGLKVSSL